MRSIFQVPIFCKFRDSQRQTTFAAGKLACYFRLQVSPVPQWLQPLAQEFEAYKKS